MIILFTKFVFQPTACQVIWVIDHTLQFIRTAWWQLCHFEIADPQVTFTSPVWTHFWFSSGVQ